MKIVVNGSYKNEEVFDREVVKRGRLLTTYTVPFYCFRRNILRISPLRSLFDRMPRERPKNLIEQKTLQKRIL